MEPSPTLDLLTLRKTMLLQNKSKKTEILYVIILVVFCLWRIFLIFRIDIYLKIFTYHNQEKLATLQCTSKNFIRILRKSDSDKSTITAIGDSLTLGAWTLKDDETYPTLLQKYLGENYKVINDGISSATSHQTAVRQGSKVIDVKISKYKKILLKISFKNGEDIHNPHDCYLVKGTIGHVYGILMSNNIFIPYNPLENANIQKIQPFTADRGSQYKETVIIWIGTNDFLKDEETLNNIGKITSSIHSGKFLVLSVINKSTETRGTATYNTIQNINKRLAEKYKDKFVDIRSILIKNYNPSLQNDTSDFNNDIPPNSLRLDDIHLNEKGNALVAKIIKDKLEEEKWVSTTEDSIKYK